MAEPIDHSLKWDQVGERYYETGVDRGVLYLKDSVGVPWNGLVSVAQSSTGGTSTAYFVDGINHVNEVSREQFSGTIEAYTYPEEFAKCDGSDTEGDGLFYSQQDRQGFSLSYRTMMANDLVGVSHGYKIHLIYNALAAPSATTSQTMSDSTEASTFSWTMVTTPSRIPPRIPTSKLTIDSTKTDPAILAELEDILYGLAGEPSRMPSMSEVITIFDDWPALHIMEDFGSGISRLRFQGLDDLKGNIDEGIYTLPTGSRLVQTGSTGIYTLSS